MSEKTIFQKIIDREIPAPLVYEDDLVAAFNDVNPQAPIHVLIVPKKVIPRVGEAVAEDQATLGGFGCNAFGQVRIGLVRVAILE